MVCVYQGEALGRYGFGAQHPFGTDRLAAFWQETLKQGLDKKVHIAEPVACDVAALARFHTPTYINKVQNQSLLGEGYLDNGDTPAFKGAFAAASMVVGSGLDGLARMFKDEERKVFVPIAGLHHARRNEAAGFCIFNDIGVLIETLRSLYQIQRIAYIDIDAHHGDGVFYSYQSDPDICIVDIHEDGRYLYPGTGAAKETGLNAAMGTKLNIPLAPEANDRDFYSVWPQAEAFVRAAKPEIIILQAGADSIAGDPITHMAFTPTAHAHATARLAQIANEFSQGRMIVTGGGGYNRHNIALGWNAALAALIEND